MPSIWKASHHTSRNCRYRRPPLAPPRIELSLPGRRKRRAGATHLQIFTVSARDLRKSPMSPQLPPPFSVPYAPDDRAMAARLLAEARLTPEREARIDRTARRLIDAIRRSDDSLGGVEDMLREFALS